jgi:hypothetical protein
VIGFVAWGSSVTRQVTCEDHDLRYIDLETRVLEPLENPFGWRIIGLSSDELVSNSPGLYLSHDETFW